MKRLHNPWPSTPRWMYVPRRRLNVHAIGPADVALARHLMAGKHGPPLSLQAAAQVVGVLTADLDLALWRSIGDA